MFTSQNYEGDEKTYIDKDGVEIVSSYLLSLFAHNSSGFDSWVVLYSLVKEITDIKIIKTAKRLIPLSYYHYLVMLKELMHVKYLNTLILHVQNLI